MKLTNILLLVFGVYFSQSINAAARPTETKGAYWPVYADSSGIPSFMEWIVQKFHEANQFGRFDKLCIEDCISITFSFNNKGEIGIRSYSKFIPAEVKKFFEKIIPELNLVSLDQKKFLGEWQQKKYVDRLILQPLVIAFSDDKCRERSSFTNRGVLSMLTKESDAGTAGVGPGQMTLLGNFVVDPFDGVVLPPFILQSSLRYR